MPCIQAKSLPSGGTTTITGLTTQGLVTVVTVNDATWTALPPTALVNRNQINVQNESAADVKINYSASIPGYVGITLASGSERQYGIRDTIIIYAKAEPGSGSFTINVEELA
jgi:hypothetical protein